jgi:general secretion pathway protein G
VLAQAQIESFLEAAYRFKADTGAYPEDLGELVVDHGSAGWRGPYLPRSIPNDQWGPPYLYRNDPGRVEPEIEAEIGLYTSRRPLADANKTDSRGLWRISIARL